MPANRCCSRGSMLQWQGARRHICGSESAHLPSRVWRRACLRKILLITDKPLDKSAALKAICDTRKLLRRARYAFFAYFLPLRAESKSQPPAGTANKRTKHTRGAKSNQNCVICYRTGTTKPSAAALTRDEALPQTPPERHPGLDQGCRLGSFGALRRVF